jgi:hypothetical protein
MAAQCCNGRLRRGHRSRGFRPCLVRMAVSARARLASCRAGYFTPVAARRKPETITSWVCPKQYLALCIKAAFSRNITRVKVASIVERGVPSALPPPAAPSCVIAILAVGISRFPGRTKDALGGVPCSGDSVPGHRWSCEYRNKDCGDANQSEFRHPYVLLVSLTQMPSRGATAGSASC